MTMTDLRTLLCRLLAAAAIGGAAPALPAAAQTLQASLSHYSTDDGLCSNAISDLQQDDYGYIWIGTWNGISRYDGFHFYNYTTGSSSRIPLLHNRVIGLRIDLNQNVWMRMYDGRVFVIDRTTDRIVNPLAGIGGSEGFVTNHPLAMTTAGDILAISEAGGIYRMRLDRQGVTARHISPSQLRITAICEGYKGDVWVGTDDGIHRVDMNDETVDRKAIFAGEHINCLYSNGYNVYAGTRSGRILSFAYGQEPCEVASVGVGISAIYADSHGLLWFSAAAQGVSRLNVQTGEVKSFTQTVPVPEYDIHGATFREANGTLWITMNHGGFGYYDREADEVRYFHNDPSNSWNLSNTAAAALPLPEGVVWESTVRRGLEKLEMLKNTIGRTKLMDDAEGANPNEIRAMYYDQQRQQLLIGNKTGHLFIYRGNERTLVTAPQPLGRIYGISMDAKGNYWLCSKGTGVIRMTPSGSGYAFRFYGEEPGNKMGLNSSSAYCSVEDRQGNIWVATYGGGVNVLTRRGGQSVWLNCDNVMRQYPKNAFRKVRTLTLDKAGNVWAGTTDGILIMAYRNGKVEVQKVEATEDYDHNLRSNDIVCLACDRNGTIWVGTNGGGLSHTVGQDAAGNWLFDNYGAKQGLPSEEIKSITFDLRGNVWFATDHILCSFDVHKHIFSTFGMLDGVDATNCSEGAALTLPNGNILFGSLAGYYTVDRRKLVNTNGSMLKLRITDFFIDNELQSPRLTDTYSYYVPDSKRVQLPSHGSEFSFRFASLNYQLQHRVHYQYMLEGYDNDWLNADKDRLVSYSGLPSGSYIFKVKAFLLESPENYDMREIEVVVPTYFLLSSAAVWLYMLLIIGTVLTLFYRRQELLARRAGKQTYLWKREPRNAAPQQPQEAEEKTDEYEIME